MCKANDRPIGRIGLIVAAVGIVCAAANAHAQVEPIIEAQIGLVEFRVPKEFVYNWVRSQQHLSVQFSYPQIEPLGRFRFGDENRQKWGDYVQGLLKRGGNVLHVTVDRLQNSRPLPAVTERERITLGICKAAGYDKFDSYSEYEIDFVVCRRGDNVGLQTGSHRQSGLSFTRDIHTQDWRVNNINLDGRIRTAVHLRKEDLKDWKAITARAYATVDSWRK